MNYFKHPLADVQSENIGEGTRIWQFAVVLKEAIIGNNCNINCHTFIENDVRLGNNVTVKSGVYLWDGIQVEDNVFIGPNATFVNNPSPRSGKYPDKHIGAFIRTGASIGANATIMGQITIGAYAMIGAASMVTKDIPAYTLWYGNPAVQKGYVTREGVILGMDLMDKNSGDRYQYTNGELQKIAGS
jgi:UDP-2-acetamido-3-amino-2,3-dideoxy-glucuronate N-acetyltransferase